MSPRTLTGWRKSSHSHFEENACVEVGTGPGVVGVRDTKQAGLPARPVLVFSAREFLDHELEGVTLASSHAFVKARDREQDLLLRLKAVLAVRRPRRAVAASA